ncbi:MAG: hypothetical protein ACI9JY_002099 [Saprospiraceae bacterium]|jgi:hypothetical protein
MHKPDERKKRPCEDEEQAAEKMRNSFLGLPYFFLGCVVPVERREAYIIKRII